MVGTGSPPTGGGSIVTPGAPSSSLLNPEETRELMAGNATTPPGPSNAAKPATASTRQRRVTFALPDDPNRATLLTKLREQEREQEDKDRLVEFLSNQGKDMPQNRKEFREWLSRVGEPVAMLSMVHDEKHVQVASNVLQYAASQRADKSWKGKMTDALGDRNKEGQDPPFVRPKQSYFEWRKVRLPTDCDD